MQSAFLRALENDALLTSDAVRRAWMITVVRRLSIDRARVRRRRIISSADIDQLPTRREEPAAPWLAITAAQLQSALETCKPHLRQVFHLYYERGLSQAQIAAYLKISPRTVATRLHRARSRLRARLEGGLAETADASPTAAYK